MAVSAFAARKAARRSIGEVTSQNEEQTSLVTELQKDSREESKPARKKRKRGKEPRVKSPREPPQTDGLLDEPDGFTEDSSRAIQSNSEIDSTSGGEVAARSMPRIEIPSTFDLSRSKILSETETEWTIRLHPSDHLAILGQYDIWVRSGAISILGAVIHASSRLHRVYAPSTHSIPPIRPVSNPFGTANPPVELTIISCASRMRMLRQIAPKFGRIWNGRQHSESSIDLSERSFTTIQSTRDDPYHRPKRLLEIPPDWQGVVSRLQTIKSRSPLAIMICGPKGAGKSTLCRILANALLEKVAATGNSSMVNNECVAFLDLDPGQPEYSPPGDLSLLRLESWNFGPPFTHPIPGLNQRVRAHHFGHLSPKEDPKHYLHCALDLLDHYRRMASEYRSCPLIINSAGWIQGNGLELVSDLIQSMGLTDVIYMSTSGPEDVVDTLRGAASRSNVTLHELVSQSSDFVTRTAKDLRMMQTLSYFHLDEPEGEFMELRWNPRPLTTVAPLVVHYAGPKQGILALAILGDAPHPEFLESVLNGCVVGVVAVDQDTGATDLEHDSVSSGCIEQGETDQITNSKPNHAAPHILRTPTAIPYLSAPHYPSTTTSLLSPAHSSSLGQALIRAIDPTTKTLQLLTPIPTSTLQAHAPNIVLVRGTLDTPTWAYRESYELARVRQRVRERELGGDEDGGGVDGDEEVRRQPWAEGVREWKRERGRGRRSGVVRRVRRDLRYRPAAVGEVEG